MAGARLGDLSAVEDLLAAQIGQADDPWQFDAVIGRPADDIVPAGGGVIDGWAIEQHGDVGIFADSQCTLGMVDPEVARRK